MVDLDSLSGSDRAHNRIYGDPEAVEPERKRIFGRA